MNLEKNIFKINPIDNGGNPASQLDYRLRLFLRPSLTFKPDVSLFGGVGTIFVPINYYSGHDYGASLFLNHTNNS